MATAPQNTQMAHAPAPNRRRATMVLWVSVVMVGFLIFALPTVIVFTFGMLPSFAAYVVDRTKEKYAMFCVASMNFCGVFPYLMDLWFDSHSIYAATNIMSDVFALFVMFGSAALGWTIYSIVPPVISSFLSVIAQQRVSALRAQQKKLIEEWGEAVAKQAAPSSAAAATGARTQSAPARQPSSGGAESPSGGSTSGEDQGAPPQEAAG